MPLVEEYLEPADSLLGMWQRGAGQGHISALDAPPDALHNELFRYILGDLRRSCDRQLDERDRYIGEIAAQADLPTTKLTDQLMADLKSGTDETGFRLAVLLQMARRGNEAARTAVVDSLSAMDDWGGVVGDLIEWEVPLDGVAASLAGKAADADAAREELGFYPFKAADSDARGFIESIPELAVLLPDPVEPQPRGKQRERSKHMERLVALSTGELLERVQPNRDGIVTLRRALASPDHDLDVSAALDAARHGTPLERAAGMVALGGHQVDELLDIAPTLVTCGTADETPHPERHIQIGAYLSVQELRTDRAVQCAQEWLSTASALAQAGLPIIAAMLPIPDVVEAVGRIDFDDVYVACSVMDELLDRGEPGAEDMVRDMFHAAAYDMLRERCLKYLLQHDKRFRTVDGVDALWDASDIFVRPAAIRGLSLSCCEERLRELASDPASEVAGVATERLEGRP